MKYLIITCLIILVQVTTACESEEINDADSTMGFVSGKVTNRSGRPLPGVQIIIDNTYLYGSNLTGHTNENGEYTIRLGFGTFQAYARFQKNYNGKEYTLDLHPDTDAGFTQEGAVRNFEWKLTGNKPGSNSGYYGGLIGINKDINSQLYDKENIEFTLSPVGNLIDGSTGEQIVKRVGQPSTESYGKLLDLPIGRYIVSAVYKGEDGDIAVKLKNFQNQNSEYVLNLMIDFEPQTSSCFNCVDIIYRE